MLFLNLPLLLARRINYHTWLEAERSDLTFPHSRGESSDIRVAHCPERVLPGQVMYELVHNDRVIGGITPRCTEAARSLYEKFVRGECVETDARDSRNVQAH